MITCRKTQHGFTLIELLVVIAIIAVLAAILFPVFARAREKARQTTCTSNQRQIDAAVAMFVQDHEETLPTSSTVWNDLNVDAGVLICPTAGKTQTNGYGYNSVLSGKALGTIAVPNQTLLTADANNGSTLINYPDNDIAVRHSKGFIAAFADGHVELIKSPGSVLVALLNAGDKVWTSETKLDSQVTSTPPLPGNLDGLGAGGNITIGPWSMPNKKATGSPLPNMMIQWDFMYWNVDGGTAVEELATCLPTLSGSTSPVAYPSNNGVYFRLQYQGDCGSNLTPVYFAVLQDNTKFSSTAQGCFYHTNTSSVATSLETIKAYILNEKAMIVVYRNNAVIANSPVYTLNYTAQYNGQGQALFYGNNHRNRAGNFIQTALN